MKYFLILSLFSLSTFAGETWENTKDSINKAAKKTDAKTREVINKGKEKYQEHKEEKQQQEEKDERAEYERLKKKYGHDCM